MYLAIIVIQLLVSVVVGVYFLRAIRKEKQGSPSGRNESSGENPTAAADSPESAAG